MANAGKQAAITFGTSGWRAIIADDFTFDNVRLVTQAIADQVKSGHRRGRPRIIVGYDTRFLSPEFARVCAEALRQTDINVLLCQRDTPTPVLAFQTLDRKLDGAINFTASHNQPEYNGIKFSPHYGGPAPKEVTADIEQRVRQLQKKGLPAPSASRASISMFDPRPAYLKRLQELVDFTVIRKAGMRIGIDCMYGTSRQYIDELIRGVAKETVVFHDYLNPLFGNRPPEPDDEYIPELITLVKRKRFQIGLACDGDADRFGIVDAGGSFLTPNEIVTLLFYYLLKTRKPAPKVARTLATTHMIDAIARAEGIEVIETPVGFKYIGEALDNGDCLIGGEESGGLSIQGHVPEKDGILACLLCTEMVAREKKTLREVLKSLYRQYGFFYGDRVNLRLNAQQKKRLLQRLAKVAQADEFAGIPVRHRDLSDGYKFVFTDGSWAMLRPSGTEPVVRIYLESSSRPKVLSLKKRVLKFFNLLK